MNVEDTEIRFGWLSKTPPPHSTRRLLASFRAGMAEPLLLWGVIRMLIDAPTLPRVDFDPTRSDYTKLRALVPDLSLLVTAESVVAMLAQGEWEAVLRVNATGSWTDKVPSCSLSSMAGGSVVLLASLSEDKEYKRSVRKVGANRPLGIARQLEIASQWDEPDFFMALALGLSKEDLDLSAYVWTCLAIDIASGVVTAPVHRLKRLLGVPRPHEIDVSIEPLLPVPQHCAFPGGHAAVVYTVARMLSRLTGADGAALADWGSRIAENREAAGLHCSADTAAGKTIGEALGDWLINAPLKHPDEYPVWRTVLYLAAEEWGKPSLAPPSSAPSAVGHDVTPTP